jgi:hypothetical protein
LLFGGVGCAFLVLAVIARYRCLHQRCSGACPHAQSPKSLRLGTAASTIRTSRARRARGSGAVHARRV